MSGKQKQQKEVKPLYKQSETVVIKRSQIKFAPYNPKQHSKEAVQKIRGNIKRVAFLGGIVWNATTGNLIDGHKRVMSLDIIHRYDGDKNDYDVKVEKISLDEKTEKEQNVFQTVSRTDIASNLLAELVEDIDISFAGLTESDMRILEAEVPDFDFVDDTDGHKAFDDIRKSKAERKAEMQEKRRANKSKISEGDTYVVLTFKSYENKAYFMERFGFGHNDEFISGEHFEKIIERVE